MTNIDRPILDSYWVIPQQFLAGEYPGTYHIERTRQRLDAFVEFGIDTYIDLTTPDELPSYMRVLNEQAGYYNLKVSHKRFAIRDFSTPDPGQMVKILNYIDSSLQGGKKIYLHCWGGIGRTGTTVGCYLVRHGLTGEQALEQLAQWWKEVPKSILNPNTPETDTQRNFICAWQPGQ